MRTNTPHRIPAPAHISISRACPDDLETILALQYAAYQSEAALLGTDDIPPLKQTLAAITAEFGASLFLKAVDDNGNIVGSVRGRLDGGTLFIGKLIVAPPLQGQGIGTRLLAAMEQTCPCSRYELFTSSKSLRNIALYERAGYTAFKKERMAEDLYFIFMQKIPGRAA